MVTHGRGKWRMEWVASTLTLPRNVVYTALLMLMRTTQLPAVDWTDAPTDLHGLVCFGETKSGFCACAITFHKHSTTLHIFIADAKVRLCEKISIYQRGSVDWSRTACRTLRSRLTVPSYGRQRNDLQYFNVSWVMCNRLSSEYSN
jgi:hypothetical protein